MYSILLCDLNTAYLNLDLLATCSPDTPFYKCQTKNSTLSVAWQHSTHNASLVCLAVLAGHSTTRYPQSTTVESSLYTCLH